VTSVAWDVMIVW